MDFKGPVIENRKAILGMSKMPPVEMLHFHLQTSFITGERHVHDGVCHFSLAYRITLIRRNDMKILLSATLVEFILLVHTTLAGAISSRPPLVIWDFASQVQHTGYGGISNPTSVRGRSDYEKPIRLTDGGCPAVSTDETWDYGWQTSTSEGSLEGTLGPSFLRHFSHLRTKWSGTFIIEEGFDRAQLSAWVRMPPGMLQVGIPYEVVAKPDEAIWSGITRRTGTVTVQAAGQNQGVGGGASAGQSTSIAKKIEGTVSLATQLGQFRQFIEYPGVTYAQVLFPLLGGGTTTRTQTRVDVSAGESCILACEGPSQAIGIAVVNVVYMIRSPQGLVPNNGGGFKGNGLLYPVSSGVAAAASEGSGSSTQPLLATLTGLRTITWESLAYDPDNSESVGDGIAFYEWYVDGIRRSHGEFASSFAWTPETYGEHEIKLDAWDDEGYMTSTVLPVTVVPEPSSSVILLGLLNVLCARLPLRRS